MEDRKLKVDEEMDQHIKECQNKFCEEINPEDGIGSWRVSDCYKANKLTQEWLKFKNI